MGAGTYVDLLQHLLDDAVPGVDFQRLLLAGVVTAKTDRVEKRNRSCAQRCWQSRGGFWCSLCGDVFARLVSLSLHDPLHVSGPAVLTGHQSAGRVGQSLRDDGLLDLLEKDGVG